MEQFTIAQRVLIVKTFISERRKLWRRHTGRSEHNIGVVRGSVDVSPMKSVLRRSQEFLKVCELLIHSVLHYTLESREVA